jgi:hypothetical protein
MLNPQHSNRALRENPQQGVFVYKEYKDKKRTQKEYKGKKLTSRFR